jgi:hypothetical protein
MAGPTEKQREKWRAAAASVLGDDEELLDVTVGVVEVQRMGQKSGRFGVLAVTPRRVVMRVKKMGGFDLMEFYYDALSSVDHNRGLMFGSIDIAAHGDRTKVERVPKEDVERIAALIREQVTAHRSGAPAAPTAAAPPTSAANQVRELARLRDEGLMTDDEFGAKRRELLGL